MISREQRAQQILKQLIRIRTPQPAGDEKDAVSYLYDLFEGYPVERMILDHGGNRASMVVTVPGTDRSRSVAVAGHLDTVGVDREDLWQYAPFSAFCSGDKVYGRGAADMKGGVTSIVLAALTLLERGFRPVPDVRLCFTADEETGGMGARALCGSGCLDNVTELVIVKPTNERIGLAEKGAIWLSLEVEGAGSHAAVPENGVNAVEQAAVFAQSIAKWLRKKGKYRLLGYSTCTITRLHGGIHANVVPERAQAAFDIRTSPNIDHASLLEQIRRIADEQMHKNASLKLSYTITQDRPALGMDEDAPLVRRFAEIFGRLKMPWETTGIRYFTDASVFVPWLGVPFVIIGPGEEIFFHQPDEYVSLQSVLRISQVLEEYLWNMTKKHDEEVWQ